MAVKYRKPTVPGRDCHDRFLDYRFTGEEESQNFVRDFHVNKVNRRLQKIRVSLREHLPETFCNQEGHSDQTKTLHKAGRKSRSDRGPQTNKEVFGKL